MRELGIKGLRGIIFNFEFRILNLGKHCSRQGRKGRKGIQGVYF